MQYIFFKTPGPIPPSLAAFPLDKSEANNSSKDKLAANLEGAFQEVSK
jgi:hypothetical protein